MSVEQRAKEFAKSKSRSVEPSYSLFAEFARAELEKAAEIADNASDTDLHGGDIAKLIRKLMD